MIGAEKLSDWMDWDDRSTCIIFADGAGAAVVGAAPDAESVGIGPVAWGSAGDQSQTIRINPDTRALHQEGQAVFRWATTRVAPVALRAIELAGLAPADIDVLVPHQANLRIIEAVAKRLRSQGRARRPARRRRHRALGQHLVGLDPAGPGPHAHTGPPAVRRDRAARRLRRGVVVRGAGRRLPLRTAGPDPDPDVPRPPQEENSMADIAEIQTGLAEIVEEVAGIDAAEVTPDKSFVDDLDIDSLSMVEIAVQAEDRFGVKIPDDQLAQLKTVSDAVDYIAKNQ